MYFTKLIHLSGEKKQGTILQSPDGYNAIQLETPYHVKWVESGKNQLLTEDEVNSMKRMVMCLCTTELKLNENLYYNGSIWERATKKMIETAPFTAFHIIGEIEDGDFVDEQKINPDDLSKIKFGSLV